MAICCLEARSAPLNPPFWDDHGTDKCVQDDCCPCRSASFAALPGVRLPCILHWPPPPLAPRGNFSPGDFNSMCCTAGHSTKEVAASLETVIWTGLAFTSRMHLLRIASTLRSCSEAAVGTWARDLAESCCVTLCGAMVLFFAGPCAMLHSADVVDEGLFPSNPFLHSLRSATNVGGPSTAERAEAGAVCTFSTPACRAGHSAAKREHTQSACGALGGDPALVGGGQPPCTVPRSCSRLLK